jgi:hypothetical protein
LNYIVAWWAGNVGYRRPQLSRTIGDDFAAIETGDTGSDSGVPTLQGLVGLSVPLSGRPLGVGVYGHAGKENLHRQLGGESLNLSSSSVGAYLSMPLGGALGLSAEAWSGSNLDDFLGGIGQGLRVSGTTANAVRARGGWAELKVRASERVGLHVGLSRDDADADDLDAGSRDLNEVFWGTVTHDAGGDVRVLTAQLAPKRRPRTSARQSSWTERATLVGGAPMQLSTCGSAWTRSSATSLTASMSASAGPASGCTRHSVASLRGLGTR